VTVKWWWL